MADAYRYIGKAGIDSQCIGKVKGAVLYCADMHATGMLHIALKRSEVAHGRIVSIHCEDALQMPEVVAIYTYQNTPSKRYDRGRVAPTEIVPNQERLFDRHIRFMGERVAAVVAKSYEAAVRACQKIQVEYEALPAILTTREAMQPQAPKLHDSGNVIAAPTLDYGDYENCQAAYIHRSETHIGRVTHLTMEPQATRAQYDKANDKLTIWAAAQSVFGIRSTVAEFLDMPYSKVRVIKAPMGGSFGSRQETLLEPLAAFVALDLQADVRLVYTREEQVVNTYMKTNMDARVESKVSGDGKIMGLSVSNVLDAGAYQTVTPDYASTIGGKLAKVYRMPNIHYEAMSVCTNTPATGGFRSWGTGEAALILENHWNMVAREIGMDPIEFRLKNILEPYAINPLKDTSIGSALYRKCLERGRDAFLWEERKLKCRAQKNDRFRYGVGMALTSHTSALYPAKTDTTSVIARVQEDGSIVLITSIHDHGCGACVALKKIAAEVLQIDLSQIELREADTEAGMYDYGCYSSRSIHVIGAAVQQCCEALLEAAKKVAAVYWQCSETVIRYQDGMFYRGVRRDHPLTLGEVARFSLFTMWKDLYQVWMMSPKENPHVAAAHFAQVEVDTYIGRVRLVDYLAVHDIGRVINPHMCMGQLGGGIQQGMGIALCEEIKLHPVSGQVLIDNLKDYEAANAADMPEYQAIFIEEPGQNGPYGAKSIGEVVVAPVAPAIVAAVNDALGMNLTHLPLTPAVILEALEREK